MQKPRTPTPLTDAAVNVALTASWTKKFGSAPNWRSICVLLAHVELETGLASCMNFNLGNCKAKADGPYDFTIFSTYEVINGTHVNMKCAFRAFDTLEAGADFYLDLLHNDFSSAWQSVLDGDPAKFAHMLKLRGYYTEDEEIYTKGVVGRFLYSCTTYIQMLLCGAGLTVKIDGGYGVETHDALMAFQKMFRLTETGIADDATIAELLTVQNNPYVDAPDTTP